MTAALTAPGDTPQQAPAYTALQHIRPQDLTASGRIPGLTEAEVISGPTVGARQLWVAHIRVAPGLPISPVHHHGAGEGAFYVLRGCTSFFFGDGLRQRVDVRAGEYLFVPAWTIHAEANLGAEEAEIIAVRSTPEPVMFVVPHVQVPEHLRERMVERV